MGNAPRTETLELGSGGSRRRQLTQPVPGLSRLDSPRSEGSETAGLDRARVAATGAQLYDLQGNPMTWEEAHRRNRAWWMREAAGGEVEA